MEVKSSSCINDYQAISTRLAYDPENGSFTWREVPENGFRGGSAAGCVYAHDGYHVITIRQKRYKAHRLAWLLTYGSWPALSLDHINGQRADNRISNLRECTNAENQQNLHRPHSDSTYGILGVYLDGDVFRAAIQVNGKKKYLGRFKNETDAREAYMRAKNALHPFSDLSMECAA